MDQEKGGKKYVLGDKKSIQRFWKIRLLKWEKWTLMGLNRGWDQLVEKKDWFEKYWN